VKTRGLLSIVLFAGLTAWGAPPPVSIIDQKMSALSKKAAEDPLRLIAESRLLYWKARYTDDKDQRREIAEQALTLAEKARAAQPGKPAPLFVWLAAKGEISQLKSKLVAVKELPDLEKKARELREVSPSFEHYAADRILGRLYHKAPSIISIGSTSKARECFEKVMTKAGNFPANQIFYADFLFDEGETAKARELAQKVLQSPELEKYPIERADWERLAHAILEKSGEKS